MVSISQITKSEFIDLYAAKCLDQVINITIGTEQRIYGITTVQSEPELYKVVYCVV